ncbi:MAG: phasin family protein [Methylocystis sp.]
MATQGKANQQRKSVDAGQEVPVEAPAEVTRADAPAGKAAAKESMAPAAAEASAPVAAEPPVEAAAPAAEPEITASVPAPLAIVEQMVDSATESVSASFEFDAALWSKKSVAFWAENAAAFLDLAERIASARSLEEIVDLQSRFASARFEAFVRQSQDLMEFAKGMAVLPTASLRASHKQAA